MTNPTHPEIEALAYALWEAKGRPEGTADADWAAAERQLQRQHESAPPQTSRVDEASKESFPASDAPGNHLPDRPPSNAADKWSASAAAAAAKTRARRS